MATLESERKTLDFMIRYYCSAKHGKGEICRECNDLLLYANRRLDLCRYGDNKKSCRKCPTHCYSPEKREAIRRVMRFVGPRMIYLRPLAGIRHLLNR